MYFMWDADITVTEIFKNIVNNIIGAYDILLKSLKKVIVIIVLKGEKLWI